VQPLSSNASAPPATNARRFNHIARNSPVIVPAAHPEGMAAFLMSVEPDGTTRLVPDVHYIESSREAAG
jgi:hypothetical protein